MWISLEETYYVVGRIIYENYCNVMLLSSS